MENPSTVLSDLERAYAEKHGLKLADARAIVRAAPANRPLVEWYRRWARDHTAGPSPEAEQIGSFTLAELTSAERAKVRKLMVDKDRDYGSARSTVVAERSAVDVGRLDLQER